MHLFTVQILLFVVRPPKRVLDGELLLKNWMFSLSFFLLLQSCLMLRRTHTPGWQVWEAGFDVTSGASPFPIRLSRPPVWLLDEELCFRPAGLIKAPRAITASSCREIDPMPHCSSAEIPQSSPHHLTILCFTNSQKKKKYLKRPNFTTHLHMLFIDLFQ